MTVIVNALVGMEMVIYLFYVGSQSESLLGGESGFDNDGIGLEGQGNDLKVADGENGIESMSPDGGSVLHGGSRVMASENGSGNMSVACLLTYFDNGQMRLVRGVSRVGAMTRSGSCRRR